MQCADVVFVADQRILRLFLWGIQSVDVDDHTLASRDRIACIRPISISKIQGSLAPLPFSAANISTGGWREEGRNIPFGASAVGGTTVTAFTYPEPGLKVLSCSNGADGLGFRHKIAVESRDADSIRSSVGDASPRTCSAGPQRKPVNVRNRCEG